jgi:hypothetical protein
VIAAGFLLYRWARPETSVRSTPETIAPGFQPGEPSE